MHILTVALSERRAAEDAAEVRQAATQEAVERAKTDEMVQLALTVNVKWGGYDPEPLEPTMTVGIGHPTAPYRRRDVAGGGAAADRLAG